MDRKLKQELRIAAAMTAVSYPPAVIAMSMATGSGFRPAPEVAALFVSAALAYFLALDVLLPVGRSKIGMLIDCAGRTEGTSRSQRPPLSIGECTSIKDHDVQVPVDLPPQN